MTPGSSRDCGRSASDFESPGSNLRGRLTLAAMNLGHGRLHRWGLGVARIADRDRVLDVGCGGGAAVRRILRLTRARVGAIDHSPQAVARTRALNSKAAGCGRLAVRQATAEDIPFPDATFDVVTAFETVYFWPNLVAGLRESRRVLTTGGRIAVVNEYADRRAAGAWAQRLHMRVPDARQLQSAFEQAGLTIVEVEHHPRHGWLACVAHA